MFYLRFASIFTVNTISAVGIQLLVYALLNTSVNILLVTLCNENKNILF